MKAGRKLAIGMLVALLAAYALTRLLGWGACSWYGYQTDRETRYAAFLGCMVKVSDGWVPRGELRVLQ